MSLGTYFQSMYFMTTRFLRDNIDGVRVPKFQLFTLLTQRIIEIKMVRLCREVNYMWWGNQYLELQE